MFFGTSAFAVPSLHVVAEKTDLVGVVTQPDRPAGRGQKLQPTPVKAAALERALPIFEPTSMKAFAQELAGQPFDLFALASYGKILPQAILETPKLGALNVHPSLLPQYRGATPIQAALLNGDAFTGVSIMMMDAGMDTGNLVSQEPVLINLDDDYGTLHDRLAQRGADLLGYAIDLAKRGPLQAVPQAGAASYTRPIRKEDLVIDWSWPPQRIVNTVRAYAPSPAARATLDGESVKVVRAHLDGERVVIDELIAPNRGRMSGESYERSRRNRENS
ncbi:MAG TPA: methionyl-tRNA formyltransferase [Candidatus Acidoferrum sp.]|nr:methionyl-tRNA formyltransferase [Candidatus Acidoferrum sp.]